MTKAIKLSAYIISCDLFKSKSLPLIDFINFIVNHPFRYIKTSIKRNFTNGFPTMIEHKTLHFSRTSFMKEIETNVTYETNLDSIIILLCSNCLFIRVKVKWVKEQDIHYDNLA